MKNRPLNLPPFPNRGAWVVEFKLLLKIFGEVLSMIESKSGLSVVSLPVNILTLSRP